MISIRYSYFHRDESLFGGATYYTQLSLVLSVWAVWRVWCVCATSLIFLAKSYILFFDDSTPSAPSTPSTLSAGQWISVMHAICDMYMVYNGAQNNICV